MRVNFVHEVNENWFLTDVPPVVYIDGWSDEAYHDSR